MERANRMICGFCSREQAYSSSRPCVGCGCDLVGGRVGAYWEGGKGCRNKIKMSRFVCVFCVSIIDFYKCFLSLSHSHTTVAGMTFTSTQTRLTRQSARNRRGLENMPPQSINAEL